MNNPISPTTVMALLCFALSGCAVAVKSTNLRVAPSKPEDTRLLKSVGYVFHNEVYAIRKNRKSESEINFLESEKESWIDALSVFADRKNIFIIANGKPTSILDPAAGPAKNSANEAASPANQQNVPNTPEANPSSMLPDNATGSLTPDNKPAEINPYDEFAKTHPIVHVFVKAAPDDSGDAVDNVAYGTFWMSFLSFGITPAYLPIPYTASFTLAMPDEKHMAPAHWDYSYDRQEFYWLPILIPMGNYLASFDPDVEDEMNIRWKIEEKRRLVLMFLRDAKPLLLAQ